MLLHKIKKFHELLHRKMENPQKLSEIEVMRKLPTKKIYLDFLNIGKKNLCFFSKTALFMILAYKYNNLKIQKIDASQNKNPSFYGSVF